jgi:hypothetical protein
MPAVAAAAAAAAAAICVINLTIISGSSTRGQIAVQHTVEFVGGEQNAGTPGQRLQLGVHAGSQLVQRPPQVQVHQPLYFAQLGLCIPPSLLARRRARRRRRRR